MLKILSHKEFLTNYISTDCNSSLFVRRNYIDVGKLPLTSQAIVITINRFSTLKSIVKTLSNLQVEAKLYATGNDLYIFTTEDTDKLCNHITGARLTEYIEFVFRKRDLYVLLQMFSTINSLDKAYLTTIAQFEQQFVLPLGLTIIGNKFYQIDVEAIVQRTRELVEFTLLLHESTNCYSPDIDNPEDFLGTFQDNQTEVFSGLCCISFRSIRKLSVHEITAYTETTHRFRIVDKIDNVLQLRA